MIDHARKLIFVENPKTATYAVKCALLGGPLVDRLCDPRIATVGHEVPALLRRRYPAEWARFTRFVVVRNTWDRARSFFAFHRAIPDAVSYQATTFDAWVAAGTPPPAEDHLRARMHGEGRFGDVLGQLHYADGVDEVIVLHSFDPVRRAGELQSGLARVFQRAGLAEPVPAVPQAVNVSDRGGERFRWNPETIRRLGERYAEEIAVFGFQAPPAG